MLKTKKIISFMFVSSVGVNKQSMIPFNYFRNQNFSLTHVYSIKKC